jgi:muramoyltetrapeptide carboxypeptidase
MTKPPRLEAGATLGVVAPSSAIRDGKLERGVSMLEDRGFKVELAPHVHDRWGYLAGLDERRAADFTEMFRRADIAGVICARGGYGAARMVSLADWDAVRASPKVLIGYSDITTLHLAAERFADLVTFHGPMVTSLGPGISELSVETLIRSVTVAEPPGLIEDPARPARCLVPGRAQGRLAGGCITLLCSALGTPYAPDFTDRIVVLEDTDEALYRVDRMLMQLAASGLLDRAAGFIVGTVSNLLDEQAEHALRLEDMWHQYLVPLGKPTIVDFPIGHVDSPLTLPLGCMAELDARNGQVTITEPAVC